MECAREEDEKASSRPSGRDWLRNELKGKEPLVGIGERDTVKHRAALAAVYSHVCTEYKQTVGLALQDRVYIVVGR